MSIEKRNLEAQRQVVSESPINIVRGRGRWDRLEGCVCTGCLSLVWASVIPGIVGILAWNAGYPTPLVPIVATYIAEAAIFGTVAITSIGS